MRLNRVGRWLTSSQLTVRRAAVVISLFTLTLTSVSAVLIFVFDREDYPNLASQPGGRSRP